MRSRGLFVLPLRPGSKVPSVKGWPEWSLRCSLNQLSSLPPDYAANFGVHPGPSGHFVLDIDCGMKNGKQGVGLESLAALVEIHGALPKTFTVKTPTGGLHLYFKGIVANTVGQAGPNLDSRCNRGYVVAPGSQLDTGMYEIVDDRDPVPAPEWLIACLQPKRKPALDRPVPTMADKPEHLDDVVSFLKRAPVCIEGTNGDIQLFRVFCECRDLGVTRETALHLVETHYNPRCQPPWNLEDESERTHFETKARNAYTYAKNSFGAKTSEAALASARTDFAAVPSTSTEPDSASDWKDALGRAVLTPSEIGKLNLPKRRPILGAWFLEGDLGFIYGPRGLGKTWLAMLIGRAISDGKAIGPWQAPEARKVLYVDGEMAVDASLERAEKLAQGTENNFLLLHHEPLFHLTGKVLNLTSEEAQAALTTACLTQLISVLILDNISCLFTLKENESDAWGERVLPWLLELRRHRIAVVFVHHAGRNGLMRGTSKREDAAFWSIKLSESKGEHSREGASFVATFDKNRNSTSEDAAPLLWHFEKQSDGSVNPKWKSLTTIQVFVGLVEDGLDSCGDIAQEMGATKGWISKLAKRAEREGLITIERRHYLPKK